MYYPLVVSTLVCFRSFLITHILCMEGYTARKKIEYIYIHIYLVVIETILLLTFSVDCTLLNKRIQTLIHIEWLVKEILFLVAFIQKNIMIQEVCWSLRFLNRICIYICIIISITSHNEIKKGYENKDECK